MSAFTPDYAIPPGATLRDTLAAQAVSQLSAARTLGFTAYRFRALLCGRRELTVNVACQLNALTGIPASFWNQAQSNYVAKRKRLDRQPNLRCPRPLAERKQQRVVACQALPGLAQRSREYPERRLP